MESIRRYTSGGVRMNSLTPEEKMRIPEIGTRIIFNDRGASRVGARRMYSEKRFCADVVDTSNRHCIVCSVFVKKGIKRSVTISKVDLVTKYALWCEVDQICYIDGEGALSWEELEVERFVREDRYANFK